jgi:hypothetical protein
MRELRIGSLVFRNPVVTASAPFGMGEVFRDLVDIPKSAASPSRVGHPRAPPRQISRRASSKPLADC